jgi:RNA polymerase-interacting CarD/CdnL/TRCF family regulator
LQRADSSSSRPTTVHKICNVIINFEREQAKGPNRQSRRINKIYYNKIVSGVGHTVAHLVEALCYKPEDRGFDSQLRHRNL